MQNKKNDFKIGDFNLSENQTYFYINSYSEFYHLSKSIREKIDSQFQTKEYLVYKILNMFLGSSRNNISIILYYIYQINKHPDIRCIHIYNDLSKKSSSLINNVFPEKISVNVAFNIIGTFIETMFRCTFLALIRLYGIKFNEMFYHSSYENINKLRNAIIIAENLLIINLDKELELSYCNKQYDIVKNNLNVIESIKYKDFFINDKLITPITKFFKAFSLIECFVTMVRNCIKQSQICLTKQQNLKIGTQAKSDVKLSNELTICSQKIAEFKNSYNLLCSLYINKFKTLEQFRFGHALIFLQVHHISKVCILPGPSNNEPLPIEMQKNIFSFLYPWDVDHKSKSQSALQI